MSFADLLELTRADKPGGLIFRGVIWLLGVLIIATAVDHNKSERGIRVDAGWFFLFLLTAGILSYVIFGFVPTF